MYIGNSSIIDEVCNILKAIHKLTRECIVQSEHLFAFLLFFLTTSPIDNSLFFFIITNNIELEKQYYEQ